MPPSRDPSYKHTHARLLDAENPPSNMAPIPLDKPYFFLCSTIEVNTGSQRTVSPFVKLVIKLANSAQNIYNKSLPPPSNRKLCRKCVPLDLDTLSPLIPFLHSATNRPENSKTTCQLPFRARNKVEYRRHHTNRYIDREKNGSCSSQESSVKSWRSWNILLRLPLAT